MVKNIFKFIGIWRSAEPPRGNASNGNRSADLSGFWIIVSCLRRLGWSGVEILITAKRHESDSSKFVLCVFDADIVWIDSSLRAMSVCMSVCLPLCVRRSVCLLLTRSLPSVARPWAFNSVSTDALLHPTAQTAWEIDGRFESRAQPKCINNLQGIDDGIRRKQIESQIKIDEFCISMERNRRESSAYKENSEEEIK